MLEIASRPGNLIAQILFEFFSARPGCAGIWLGSRRRDWIRAIPRCVDISLWNARV